MATKEKAAPKKKKDIKITSGILRVTTSENNTMIVLVDEQGNKICGGGTGLMWYKGAKQNTPYAAEVLTKHVLKEGQGFGLKEVGIVFKGVGMAREGVFKAVNEIWLVDVQYIKEATPLQFGGVKGVRPKKT